MGTIQKAPLDLQLIWARVDSGEVEGRNGLVKLAIHIFTVVANSAGCERVFSSFGISHSKLRNKIDSKRGHKMTVVRMQLKREDRDLDLSRQRRKRNFGDEDGGSSSLSTPSTGSDTTADLGPTNFRDYAAGLIRQAEISNAADVLEDTSPPLNPAVATPSYTFSPPPVIPSTTSTSSTGPSNEPPRPTCAPSKTLTDLFDFTVKPEDGLEFHWPGGKKNLADDLRAHEDALADEFASDGHASSAIPQPSAA